VGGLIERGGGVFCGNGQREKKGVGNSRAPRVTKEKARVSEVGSGLEKSSFKET